MKKILLITRPISPPWDEASKNFAYYLAKSLDTFEFLLLTKGRLEELPSRIEQKPIYTSNHLDIWQKLRILKVTSFKNKVDIIHFMLTPAKLNAFGFKTFLKSRRAKTIQTIATLREDLFSASDFKKILFANHIITYSDYAKNKLNALGFSNITRIYPGIDLEKYVFQTKDLPAMELFKISENDFVITYPGEYTRLGATDEIVASLPTLFEKIPNAKFVFACRVKNEKDALKKAEVVTKLKEKGILEKVIFTDTFTDMPKLYNLSDIVVFPVHDMKGKFDVPLAVIEAMACEKPVIISDLPILQEFATKENSVIIKTGETSSLIAACEKLQQNPEQAISIGKSAREYVEKNFNINDVAKKYAEVYEQLLS